MSTQYIGSTFMCKIPLRLLPRALTFLFHLITPAKHTPRSQCSSNAKGIGQAGCSHRPIPLTIFTFLISWKTGPFQLAGQKEPSCW